MACSVRALKDRACSAVGSIRMIVCHRAGFFALVAEPHVGAKPQSPRGALSSGRQAGRRATVGISDVESSVDRVAMGESASGCGGKRRSLIRVDASGRRSSSVQR